jgi:hypothetical protein
MLHKHLYIFILFIFPFVLEAQRLDNYAIPHMENYIVDGQTYTLTLSDGTTAKAYLTMFKGFDYRVHISSKTIKNYKISLFDIEKKMLFSGTCENFEKTNDLKFQSNFTGYLQIDILEGKNDIKDKVFNIVIGFKESKATK